MLPGEMPGGFFMRATINLLALAIIFAGSAPAAPAIHKCGAEKNQLEVEYESIRLSLGRLLTFPFIVERVKNVGLQLIGAHFKITDGTVSVLDPQDQEFKLLGDTPL